MSGLKDYPKMVKGTGLRYRIKELYWQLRYAWQRAWKGYDYTDVFELGFNFAERMPTLLREFKKYNVGLFPDLDKNDGSSLTEEQTDAVLDEMIFYFENCDEDVVYQRLFGVDSTEDYLNNKEQWSERIKPAGLEQARCWNEAMRLFAKWSGCLWY